MRQDVQNGRVFDHAGRTPSAQRVCDAGLRVAHRRRKGKIGLCHV